MISVGHVLDYVLDHIILDLVITALQSSKGTIFAKAALAINKNHNKNNKDKIKSGINYLNKLHHLLGFEFLEL